MKRIFLTFILATICGISAFAYSFYQVCESGQTLYYNITSSALPYTVKVVSENSSSPYYSTYPIGDLVIPSTVTYNNKTYSITSIGDKAFRNCSELISVTIPNSVTSIGDYAFDNCSGLTSVTIPNSVTSIGNYAFSNCSELTSVTIPNSVTSIGNAAFKDCIGLTEPIYNANCFAYFPCSYATEYAIPDGIQQIAGGAFLNCSGLTSVTIPNSVTNIGGAAFAGCNGLTSVTLGNSITSIGSSAFSGCSGLTSVTIPNSVTNIEPLAFLRCSGLTSVTIPNSVTYIGERVFMGCTGLVDMTIPFVGRSASATTASAYTLFGYIFGQSDEEGVTAVTQYYSSSNNKTYYIPSSLRSVTVTGGNLLYGAFYGCSMLTSVTIGNSVTSIGEKAFCNCSGLTSLTIGNSVTSIDDKAFWGCTGLTSVTIPNSVTSIGSSAFSGCSGLVEMTIPFVGGNVTTTECTPSTVFGYIFGEESYEGGERIRQYYYTGLSSYLFYCIPQSLRSVTVTGGMLRYGAFYGCSMLTSVTISDSVTSIGSRVFSGCSGLTEMTIPLFGGNLGGLFDDRSYIGGTAVQQFSSPGAATWTCYIPSSLRSVTITRGTLGYGYFSNCSMLTSVTIGNSITSIGEKAFYNCSGLTSVTIGDSVTSLGSLVFSGCSGLTDIYANPTIPPTVVTAPNNYTFTYSNYTATLWVPCGSAEAYRAATGWSNFSDIREMLPYTLNVASADLTMGTASITQQNCIEGTAVIEATPNRGYAFSQWNDGNADNPRTITVTADVEYTASFVALPTYTITVVSADETKGTVTGGGIFYEGETATLTATANDGYVFGSWTDGNSDNPRTVTVTGNATYTATFKAWRTITVVSADETQGTVAGGGTYLEDAEIEISATPAEHYHFSQWNDGNTDNPRTITVTEDATYIAEFAIDRHNVMVISANETMGGVSEGGTYDYGTEIQISANANDGYAFLSWQDDNTDNPRTITVTGDSTFVASFAEARTVTVEVSNSEMGYAIGSGVYAEGAVIQITAVPYDNYRFDHWVDIENPNRDFNTDNPRTITVTTDVTYMAVFETITSIDENSVSEIALFPNPTTDLLNITSSETISEIEIVNVMGQVVKRIEVNSDNAVCDVEDLKAGVYVVRISTAQSDTSTTLSVRRFVKE